MTRPRLFLSPPHMGGRELDFVREAFASNYIAPVGPDLTAFEAECAAYVNRDSESYTAVALSSGTAALHLSLILCGVDGHADAPGSHGKAPEVLCSDLTFIGSVNPILYQGARPVFVDCRAEDWNLDPEPLADFLAARKKVGRVPAVLNLTHLYGQGAAMDHIAALCAAYGVTLIEDAAEALGTRIGERHAGTFGRFGVISFNGNKIITSSGGGMLLCRDEADAREAGFLATQARDPAPHYEHSRLGFNYRLSNIVAAIGRGQLTVLEERVAQKRALFEGYRERLADLDMLEWMPEPEGPTGSRATRWLTCCAFHRGDAERGYELRERIRLALEDEDIESRPVWKPMHRQPLFAGCELVARDASRPVSADLFARGLCLPSGTAMGEDDLDRVCAVVRRCCLA